MPTPKAHERIRSIEKRLHSRLSAEWLLGGDLGEVFAVLDALALYDIDAVRANWLAHAMQRLVACEVRPGGPYAGVDGTVGLFENVAVGRFLSRFDVTLAPLQAYLNGQLADAPGVPAVQPARGLVSPAARRMFADIRALQAAAAAAVTPSGGAAQTAQTALQSAVLRLAKQRMQALPAPLRQTGLQVWDEMRRADRNHEIALLPQMFASGFRSPSVATDKQLVLLGAANFFCWIATILYDDFIDEEGDPARLPIANVSYRLSLDLYRQALAHRADLYNYVERMYDTVDRANAWEVAATRAVATRAGIRLPTLPTYGAYTVQADRAFGHAIGAMLLVQQIPGIRPQQVAQLQTALQHYLIARQLNDDIHDWRKDLRAGHLSAAVVELLRGAAVVPGKYAFSTLVPRLEAYFFGHGLVELCTLLTGQVALCRRALAASKAVHATSGFTLLLDDLEASAAAAQRIQASEAAFARSYAQLAKMPTGQV